MIEDKYIELPVTKERAQHRCQNTRDEGSLKIPIELVVFFFSFALGFVARDFLSKM